MNGSQKATPSRDDEEEAEIERELQEMLSGFDMPELPELWDPEINNPDKDKFFEPGYDPWYFIRVFFSLPEIIFLT